MFSQMRCISQGSVLSSISDYSRTVVTHNNTLPLPARILNSQEANMAMLDPYARDGNADHRKDDADPDQSGAEKLEHFVSTAGAQPKISAIECERFKPIPPKGSVTV